MEDFILKSAIRLTSIASGTGFPDARCGCRDNELEGDAYLNQELMSTCYRILKYPFAYRVEQTLLD